MTSGNYQRTLAELRGKACLFWPADLTAKEASASIIPLLLQSQDKFIALLHVADKHPEAWKRVLSTTTGLPGNLFLKHLMVLADVGGEPLQRLTPELATIFPNGRMTYTWRGKNYDYQFQAIMAAKRLDNKLLLVDGVNLLNGHALTEAMQDVCMLLLHAAAATTSSVPELFRDRCIIGNLIGQKEELDRFVKQRYILVSKITSGATTNALGQMAQDYVKEMQSTALPGWDVRRNGTIPGISHNAGATDINFDVVAKSPSNKYFAIEVGFQVTTNRVTERKAGQAQARANLLHEAGHKIAYVIDGAGNFQRQAALRTICRFSDCTVAFTPQEMGVLAQFLKDNS
jgi:hypothetical protein